MAITFDDLPVVFSGRHDESTQKQIVNQILQVLDKHRIKAAGFATGNKLKSPYHFELLKTFVSKGHLLGNHSFSHFDLNRSDIKHYWKDILKCEKIIDPLMGPVKYFRYPLLHRGDSNEKKQAIYRLLRENHYKIAPVSIDNDDYSFNLPVIKAHRNRDIRALKKLKKKYVDHILERIFYFEELSKRKIGRGMKHILLLHMNFLNSMFLDDLLTHLRNEGWVFIHLEEALTDPVYQLEDRYCGKKGLGWLERIK